MDTKRWRSAAAIERVDARRAKLNDATRTRHAFVEQKPKCVIVDEIDGLHHTGSDRGAVWTVINALKHGKISVEALRPIAICNDLYAPALKPLRDVAKIIRMKPPQTTQLTARVRDVSERKRRGRTAWRWRSSSIASIRHSRCVKLDATHRQDQRRW